MHWRLKRNQINLVGVTLWTYKRKGKNASQYPLLQYKACHGMLQCPVSHTQKVAHLNTSQYTTFARKGSPVFSYNLFIPFLPAWQGVTILPFIDGSSSKSLPTPGWDLLLMWSPQFNLSMRTYKKDIKTFSTRLMHQAPQRDSIIWPYEIHQPYSAFHVVKYGSV